MTYETLPRILVEESHSDIEGCTTPAFKRVSVSQRPAGLLCDVLHLDRPQTSSQQTLVGITPCGVHDEGTRVLPDSLGERLGTMFDNDVAPANSAGHGGVERGSGRVFPVGELRDDDVGLETGFANLTLDGTSVDGEVSKVGKEFLGTVLTLHELEEIGSVVNESGPGLALDENVVGKESEEEGNVGLGSTVSARIIMLINWIGVP